MEPRHAQIDHPQGEAPARPADPEGAPVLFEDADLDEAADEAALAASPEEPAAGRSPAD